MAPDPALASLAFRVQMAGAAAEQAVAYLNQREVLRGRMAVQSVVYNLAAAAATLRASGQHAERLAYVQQLVSFYTAQMNAVLRPATGPVVAADLASNQGNLLSASPA